MPWNGCFRLAWAQHHTLLQPLWSRNHHFFKGVYRNSAEVEQTSAPNWRTSNSDMLKHLAAFGDARWIFSHFFWAESICLTFVSRYERTWKARPGLFRYVAYLFFSPSPGQPLPTLSPKSSFHHHHAQGMEAVNSKMGNCALHALAKGIQWQYSLSLLDHLVEEEVEVETWRFFDSDLVGFVEWCEGVTWLERGCWRVIHSDI